MTAKTLKQAELAETRGFARTGGISFAGAAISALMGFVFTVVVARSLGEYGAGVVLQSIAVFSITLGVVKCGMDSVTVWLMPRLLVSDPERIRSSLLFALLVATGGGVVGGVALTLSAPVIAGHDPALVTAFQLLAWFVAPGAVMMVALAATRGLGGILPYVLVGSIAVPVSRPLLVLGVGLIGGTASMAVSAWGIPLTLGMIAALVVLGREVRALEQGMGSRRWWPDRTQVLDMVRFSLPRTVSVGLEQSLVWLQVVLVGVIAGTAASGVYGGAARLVAAGLIADTAIRVVVSPRFSHFLHQQDLAQAQNLYRVATVWLLLLSTPIFLTLGVFAPTVLGWLGPGFVAGSAALAVLAVGSVLTMAAGNIHSVLLMSGRSGWAAGNKVVALVLNIGLNLLLVPWIGIVGAAVAWSLAIMVDAILAAIEVRLLVGMRPELRAAAYAIAVPVLTVGIPAALFAAVIGRDRFGALLLTVVIGGVALLGWCVLDRRRLHLDLRGRAVSAEEGADGAPTATT